MTLTQLSVAFIVFGLCALSYREGSLRMENANVEGAAQSSADNVAILGGLLLFVGLVTNVWISTP